MNSNVSVLYTNPRKETCKVPKMIETQYKLQCGKHAINNLFQYKLVNCSELHDTAKQIARVYNVKQSNLSSPGGFYDVSVLITFLMSKGFDINIHHTFDKKNLTTRSNALIGFIIGNGTHWLSIRKERMTGHTDKYCYYAIDSMKNQPTLVPNLYAWLKEFFKHVPSSNRMIIKVSQ